MVIIAKEAQQYIRLSVKLVMELHHITFLKTCLREQLIPKFTRYSLPPHMKQSEMDRVRRKHMRQEIKQHYTKMNKVNMDLYTKYRTFAKQLHYIEIENIIQASKERMNEEKYTLYIRRNKKLECLRIDKKGHVPVNEQYYKFHDRVTNLSTTTFNDEEKNFLERGYKFAPSKITNTTGMALELEAAIRGNVDESEIRTELIPMLRKIEGTAMRQGGRVNNKHEEVIKNIRHKIERNNLIVTTADKNAGMVILNKEDYIQKTNKFLTDNNYTELKKDPLNKFVNRTKAVIKIARDTITKYSTWNMSIMNPRNPRLYGQPKLHKHGTPIRPVVSYIDTPTYKIAKFVNHFITRIVEFKPRYTVKNRIELINNINNINLNVDYEMVSFDVTNLFTNIPVQETLQLLSGIISDHVQDTEDTTNMMKLISLCMDQNYCKFNEKFYSMTDGVPMGSPLSCVIADVFMNELEHKIIMNSDRYADNILMWNRYVDDVLVIWKNTPDNSIEELHKYINSIHTKIQFTIEKENNNSLNFLDLTLMKEHNRITYKIYRKPTATDIVIPYDSYHAPNIKMASFRSLIDRLYSVPMSMQDINNEKQIVLQIGRNNGYTQQQINKIFTTHENKIYLRNYSTLYDDNHEKKESAYRSIKYQGPISYIVKKKLSRYGIDISFKTDNNMKVLLGNAKDKMDMLQCSGVYKLECGCCSASYVGETGRALNVRIEEHLKNKNSYFYKHLNIHGHTFDKTKNVKLIHKMNKCHLLELTEMYEINKLIHTRSDIQILNDQTDSYQTPLYTHLRRPYIKWR